eukprot:2187481-Prymnesium_polylepis.1
MSETQQLPDPTQNSAPIDPENPTNKGAGCGIGAPDVNMDEGWETARSRRATSRKQPGDSNGPSPKKPDPKAAAIPQDHAAGCGIGATTHSPKANLQKAKRAPAHVDSSDTTSERSLDPAAPVFTPAEQTTPVDRLVEPPARCGSVQTLAANLNVATARAMLDSHDVQTNLQVVPPSEPGHQTIIIGKPA